MQTIGDRIKLLGLRKAYKKVFSSDEGKTILKHLLELCHFYDTSIGINKDGVLDPSLTIYNEGQRSIILTVLKICNYNNEEINKMLEGR